MHSEAVKLVLTREQYDEIADTLDQTDEGTDLGRVLRRARVSHFDTIEAGLTVAVNADELFEPALFDQILEWRVDAAQNLHLTGAMGDTVASFRNWTAIKQVEADKEEKDEPDRV